ncbi:MULTISPECIES: hypothetical protein [Methylobacterium]|jgi:uncharacterized protein YjbI with pentapeptide repeats|nr:MULTISPECIES: hypothetical protein [Methylobacterium]KOX60852.1 hypothetical protein ADL19_01575 [Streptomyces purpurogeneiscleroticus]APT30840.1 hypothetical protein MCBMB27_01549 [Methylobacterium phyllosphaerae]AWV17726.1 hypothetical protein A3862_21310 [Methylobacterium sp. XJLW]MBA9063553.1 uncharacterized protein YjbI with pentapeptide repeats [Methylobacterium fujisawaense]MBP31206.1 hypothetical protein [Methylobacterium sp.]
MPHFYLHIRDGQWLIEDLDGADLADLDAARAEAERSARALLEIQRVDGAVLAGQSFEIADASGAVLAVVPLKDVLELP